MPQQQIAFVNFRQLGQDLRRAAAGFRSNPPRVPAGLVAIYDRIARLGFKGEGERKGLLSENQKVLKGRGAGWYTNILHMMPANDAKRLAKAYPGKFGVSETEINQLGNVCPGASAGCMALCLISSGQLALKAGSEAVSIGHAAAMRRTLLNQLDNEGFFTLLILQLVRKLAWARKHGFKYAVRLNGTSDIDYENIPVAIQPWFRDYLHQRGVRLGGMFAKGLNGESIYPNIMSALPAVRFYDYTKVAARAERFASGKTDKGFSWPANYYLTLSLSEKQSNRVAALGLLLRKAINVVVPFDVDSKRVTTKSAEALASKTLPKTLIFYVKPGEAFSFPVDQTKHADQEGFTVIDGDETDLRFLDGRLFGGLGKIVGLRFKKPKVPAAKAATPANTGIDKFIIPAKYREGNKTRVKSTVVIPVLTTFPATVAEAKALNGQVS